MECTKMPIYFPSNYVTWELETRYTVTSPPLLPGTSEAVGNPHSNQRPGSPLVRFREEEKGWWQRGLGTKLRWLQVFH